MASSTLCTGRSRAQQVAVGGQPCLLKITQQKSHGHFGKGAFDPMKMEEPLAPAGRVGRARGVGQQVGDLRRQVKGIDHLAFGRAGMGRHAGKVYGGFVSGECLEIQLAQIAAVEGVGELGIEQAQIDAANAGAGFLVGCKAEPDFAVGDLRVREQLFGQGHEDGDARFVIGAQYRASRGRDQGVADLGGQIRVDLGQQHQQFIVRKGKG
jgi:hypothetical protein